MQWPLLYQLPGSSSNQLLNISLLPPSTVPSVVIRRKESMVVGVTKFNVPATELVAKGYTQQLKRDLSQDGLIYEEEDDGRQDFSSIVVAQYDALFSLNKRRNEVFVRLIHHPWL